MTSQEVFLLDSNVFIQPKNTWYPFDVFPGYWRFLKNELGGERVKSIAPIYEELQGHEDELAEWTKKQLGRKRFEDVAEDEAVFARYLEVAEYVRSLEAAGKRRNAIEEFLGTSVADPWLIARASIYGETLVSMEVSHLAKKSKVSLVDVCEHFDVRCCEVIDFLRKARAVFDLREPAPGR